MTEEYSLEAVIDGLAARLVARPVDVRVTAVSNLYLIRAALANGALLEALVDRDADTEDLPWLILSPAEVRTRVGAALMVAWCQTNSFAAAHPLPSHISDRARRRNGGRARPDTPPAALSAVPAGEGEAPELGPLLPGSGAEP